MNPDLRSLVQVDDSSHTERTGGIHVKYVQEALQRPMNPELRSLV
jgi:hypothetical protein